MNEQEELIEYAKRNLELARQQQDELNILFYSKALAIYQGTTGPFWGSLLKYTKENNEIPPDHGNHPHDRPV